jgi:hypothetical protein
MGAEVPGTVDPAALDLREQHTQQLRDATRRGAGLGTVHQ